MADESTPGRAQRLFVLIEELAAELRPGRTTRPGLDSLLDRDLGLDSLARVELLARIERSFGLRLPPELLGEAETVSDLLAALDAAAPAGTPPPSLHVRRETAAPATGGFPDHAASLIDVLVWHAERHPERTHVHFLRSETDTETLSYGELLAGGRELAAGLRRAGVRPGQFVALMLPTGLEFFHSFYGILLAGAVPVPIYPPTRPGQVEDHLRRQAGILGNCEAVALVSFDAARVVAQLLSGLVPSLHTVTTPQALRAAGAGQPGADHAARSGDVAFLQYTSGSTGDPKGVTLDHGNLLANIRAWGRAVDLGPAEVVVSWLPLYHDMGLIGAWLGSLYHACPLVLMSPLDFLSRPERWLWAIHEYRGTVTAAPNFAFELCLRHADPQRLQGLDLSSWRYAANGAEPVGADTLARFAAAFHPYGFRAEALAPAYGLAECSVGLAVSPPGRGPRIDRVQREALARGEALPAAAEDDEALRLVACGIPLPGHEVRIVDEAGVELPPRRVGRLEFRGPSATRGYWRNPEATARLIRKGWLDSGDLAYLAEGDIVITGRVKDMIIRGGRNLYPYEMEQAVGRLPGVRRGCVAVFGAAAPGEGTERLVVVAETRMEDAAQREQLAAAITALGVELLGTPPDDVVLAPPHAVLKTSSGKIRRAATRDAWLRGELARAGRAPWRQLLRLGASGLRQGLARGLTRAGRLAYGAYAWLVVLPLGLLAAGGILLLPTLHVRWRWVAALARMVFRLWGMPIESRGAEVGAGGTAIFAANHASYLDGLLLVAVLPRPVAFVAKRELAGHPAGGALLGRLGVMYVERFDAAQGISDLERIAALHPELPPFFFAEGTFTRQPGLRDFRLGAFQLAAASGRAVIPVAIAGTREALRDGSWLPRRHPLRVSFGAPLPPAGTGWSDQLRLRDATRQAILGECGEPDLAGGGER